MAQKTKAVARSSRTSKPQGGKQQGKSSKPKAVEPAPVKAKSGKPEKQIEQAKAALKKEKAQAAAPTPAPVKEAKASRARKISIDIGPNEAVSVLAQKWSTLYKKAEQIEAKPYNMRNVFEEKTAITHKVLGWGYILANRNDRLEVLFKDGIKYLISNYKP